MADIKLCTGCRHFRQDETAGYCVSPQLGVSPVDGEAATPIRAWVSRYYSDNCGPGGKWWEPQYDLSWAHVIATRRDEPVDKARERGWIRRLLGKV